MPNVLQGHWFPEILLLLAVAAGPFIYSRLASRPLLDRLIAASLPTVGMGLTFRLTLEIAARPWNDWDPVRLTPVFALWNGYPLYPASAAGPALSYCYGPISALAYLPVVITATPTSALLTAATMTALFMLGPILCLYLDRNILGHQRTIDGVLAFMAVTSIVLGTPALRYSLLSPVHDAVALGLGAAATAALCRRREPDSTLSLAVSSLAAILAVWAKQTMVPLLVALPIYLLIVEDARTCCRYVMFLGTAGVLAALLFLTAFGWAGLLLNMFELPSRHPFDKSLHDVLGALLLQIEYSGFVVPLLGIALLYLRSVATGRRRDDREAWGPWLAFVLIGVLQTPLALLAFGKLGGDVNAFSAPLYNLSVGTGLLLLKLDAVESRAHGPLSPGIGKLWLLVLSVVGLVAPMGTTSGVAATRVNPSETAFAFELKHPGRAYFPWNTLSVVMADGKVYDAEDGLISRMRMAGLSVSGEELRAGLPPNAKILALPPNYPVAWTQDFILEQLPEFRRPVTVRELPGWRCLKRQAP